MAGVRRIIWTKEYVQNIVGIRIVYLKKIKKELNI